MEGDSSNYHSWRSLGDFGMKLSLLLPKRLLVRVLPAMLLLSADDGNACDALHCGRERFVSLL